MWEVNDDLVMCIYRGALAKCSHYVILSGTYLGLLFCDVLSLSSCS